jgi:hypothetical protein
MSLTRKLLFLDAGLIVLLLVLTVGYLAASPDQIPAVVDLVRGVVGPEPVALAEDVFYSVTDTGRQLTSDGQTTPGYWDSTAPSTGAPAPADPPRPQPVPAAGFQPRAVTPLYQDLAAPGEGLWTAIPNTLDPAAAPLMYKTFLHPDPTRPFARVAIVAMDAAHLRLHAVAGTIEPVSPAHVARPGLIDKANLASVVAAFNGGFKAVHSHYGMMVDGQVILPPQPNADTIAIYRDGSLRIAPWEVVSNTLSLMQSFRQTPVYLAYQGQVNPEVQNEPRITWGASVSGQTAIWRSAFGLSSDRRTLYYAAGESLTARRLTDALIAAGASDAAELDVNQFFEQFVTFTPSNGALSEQILLDGMYVKPQLYVTLPSSRDFFYLTLAK